MSLSDRLQQRSEGQCELCNVEAAVHEYTVSPKKDDSIDNQVALCNTCLQAIDEEKAGFHWHCLEGSIWNPEASVQALSYRLLHKYKEEAWADNLINSVDLDDNIIQWALSAYEIAAVHTDAFGNVLDNGDTVVLIQALNVKGANLTLSKGTVVRKIKLVHDNVEHIEGRLNEQVIVILTKFVKKG
jgi:protein PhnA